MKISELLHTTKHRPWGLPTESWKFYQEWNDAIFLHWQVELDELKKFVPNELHIDVFEGKPWVSVVAFTMERIRLKHLPSFPPISNFDEINVRTYVKSTTKAGVYFLSIEGGTRLSCKIAKAISGLPYRYSNIARTTNQFKSSNLKYDEKLDIKFTIGKELQQKTSLDKWLTERYVLFQDTTKSVNEFEIHHVEWPLNDIELETVDLDYQRFNKLINNKPSKVHYSEGVNVIAWGKKRQ